MTTSLFLNCDVSAQILIPLSSNNQGSVPKRHNLETDNKYVQYYAGMKLACKELEQNGVLINIQLKDSERVQQLENYEKYDLVIAPNDKQIVNNLIEYGKENETLVISPWYTNSTATVENPYYLQLTPNVKEHFNKIIEHASLSFEPNEIALVGLNTPKYVKWFNYFQATYRAFTQNQSPLVEHFVLQDSLALGEWVFGEQIKNGVKAFILPNYSSRDENHVYSVLRRLNAEKGLDQITVYGMPLLINSDRIGYDYYSNLNMRIAISEHIDFSSNDASAFRSRYFNEYKDLASIDAIEGYDMINFLGDVLSQYGSGFCSSVNDIKMDYLHHSLNIQPVYSEDDLELQKVNFFENKHLEIIEFTDGKFRKSN